jgi:hypothetical protein
VSVASLNASHASSVGSIPAASRAAIVELFVVTFFDMIPSVVLTVNSCGHVPKTDDARLAIMTNRRQPNDSAVREYINA